MARPEYPRSRRVMLQAALCVILAASVGLAELVTRQRRSTAATHMAAGRDFGVIRMSLPDGWLLKRKEAGPVMFIDQEPDEPGHLGRTLTGRLDQLIGPVSAWDYLQNSDLLDGARIFNTNGKDHEDIAIAGTRGVLVGVRRPLAEGPVAEESGLQPMDVQWIACCVRPSGGVITLILDCSATDDPDFDKQTLREIARSMEIRN